MEAGGKARQLSERAEQHSAGGRGRATAQEREGRLAEAASQSNRM